MKTPPRSIRSAIFTAFLLSSTVAYADPPERVGRISYIEGTVSFHASDENDWSYATLNYPVTAGNSFWTEPNGRGEIQIGSIDVRMDHSTEMQVSRLDNNGTQIELPQGTLNIQFDTPPASGDIEVITPSGPIELTKPGTYHIDAGQPTGNGAPAPVQVTALEGQVAIQGPRSLLEVLPGETAIITGNPPNFSLQEAVSTQFDDWALARERREQAHTTTQYVSPYTTGYDDLDNYGQWSSVPDYGAVWYPTQVDADWAPYQYGHWAFVAPWGWTWIDDAPWGFAPFHYGRWAQVDNRWCWVPGPRERRPVYAPALVAFVGGDHWANGPHTGRPVGWVPLGPHEPFHPYYKASAGYTRNVNGPIGIPAGGHSGAPVRYMNSRAAMAVPAATFQQGQNVHHAAIRLTPDQLQHAPVAKSLSSYTPTHNAREEGRPMAKQPEALPEQQQRPEHAVAAVQQHTEERAAAPAAVVQHAATANPAHVDRAAESQHNNAPLVVYQAPPMHTQTRSAEPHEAYGHAPGPTIQREAAPVNRPAFQQNLPRADMPRPQQHAPITPTHEGWKRMSEEQHAAPAHAAEQHGPQNHEKH